MYCHTWEPVPTKELPLQVLGREKQQGTEQSLGADPGEKELPVH